MIEINNLTKRYGLINAIKGLSFTVKKGEIVGFLGPNGAGKSTTMNILTGYIPATEGEVKVCGFDIMDDPTEVKKKIGYLPEMPPLYLDMRVWEYLNFVSDLKGVPKKGRVEHLNEILEKLKIVDEKDRIIKNLSKGYKQRVGFAQALIGNPEVLVLDEPTVGLDPKQIIEIRNLIKSLGKEHTVILSSHILSEVSAICERVIIINKGEIVAIDTPENLSKSFENKKRLNITVEGDKELVFDTIKNIEGIESVKILDCNNECTTYLLEADKFIDVEKSLFFELAKIEAPLREIKNEELSLEEIFLELTKTSIGSRVDVPVGIDKEVKEEGEEHDKDL